MAHGKLVTQLGTRYFLERMRGIYFVYNDDVVLLDGWDERETFRAVNAAGNRVNIPSATFQGYGGFRWPALGYRKLNRDIAARISKQQIAGPGIKSGSVGLEYSPMSQYLMDNALIERMNEWDTMSAIFKPNYNTVKDLPKLFAGDVSCLVFSEQAMIEPSLRGDGDLYDVMHRGNIIGTVTPGMEIDGNTPKNKELVRRILNVRAD